MSVTGLRLDGQTIGIQLAAPSNSASLFSLDTLTGVITSGIDSAGTVFLTDADIRALKPGVDALFTLVPAAERTGMAAADALALLVKLCTVSTAADDAVTLSAVSGGGDVWALQAAATAPAYLVAHLPFSADGSVAWAVGIGGGGGGGGVQSVGASAPLASSGGVNPVISFSGVLDAAHGGTGLSGSGASNTQYLRSNGVGGWELGTPGGGLTNWQEGLADAAPNSAAFPAVSLSALNLVDPVYGDADAVIAPFGVGSNLAQIPDGTATGGNKRGAFATDWQKSRYVASQVASGGGAAICGGAGNEASGGNSFIGSGLLNISSGSGAVAVGGNNNIASGQDSAVLGGAYNEANGQHSTIPGGNAATTRNTLGKFAYASGASGVLGDSQMAIHVVRANGGGILPVNLTADGSNSPNGNNVTLVPFNSAYKVRAEVAAKQVGANVAKAWTLECLVRRGSSPNPPVISGAIASTVFGADAGAAAWDATLVVDTINGAILVQGTGDIGTSIRFVATIYTTEVVSL